MKILTVTVESSKDCIHTMKNPIFKVKYPDGTETIYDLYVSGIEMGKDRRIIVLKPTTVAKDVGTEDNNE